MEPSVGEPVDRSNLVHGQLYYIKFDNSDNYHLGIFNKYKSPNDSPITFAFIEDTENIDFDDDYIIYKVKPENFMTDKIQNIKTRNITHFPTNLGSEVKSPQIGTEYYFFTELETQPIRGKLLDKHKMRFGLRKIVSVYDVQTAKGVEMFIKNKTTVYDILHRNNVLINTKTQRSIVKNRGVNRTIRNTLNIAKGKNNAYNRRKDLMKLWENANTSHLN